jgi:hypothetical protein
MESDRPMVRQPARALPGATHDYRRNVLALQAQLPSAPKRVSQRLPQSSTHQASAGRDRLHLCRVASRRWAATPPGDTRRCPTTPANSAMTRRTREVMFRIGGEEDLFDRPSVAPASVPQPDSAPIPGASEPLSTPWRADRPLDADIPLAPGVSEQPTETLTASATKVLDAPAPENPARPVQSMEPTPATVPDTSTSGVPAPASPLSPRSPRAHRHHDAGRRDRSTASLTRRQRPGLTRLHSWIAWVNALILTVLIVAAVIGHDPQSTTAVGRASSTTPAAARPVDSSSNTGPAMSKLPPRPLIREHRRPPSHPVRRRPPASREPTRRSPSVFIPQQDISPPVAITRRVAPSPSAAPATSTTPIANHRRPDAKAPRGDPSVEFAP